jgi:glycosyltransferase involved in cell wall biosynthesis
LYQHPHTVTGEELDEYVEMLRILSPERLVLSGAEKLHWDLLARYKAACPQTRIEIISHSSQLQWTEDHYREEFMRWLPAYHAGMIQKIWVFKRGLDTILKNYGIEAELIENYLPQRVRAPRRLSVGAPIKVGIWSVDNNWRKNLLSQFLAFAGETRFIIHYTATDTALNSLLSKFGVPHMRVNEGPLPRAQLLSWMAKMDLNLYVTLSECSPMVPLESISMGVPVLVGPTTTYFDGDPLLRHLVVPSPEDMGCIRAAVDVVLADYEKISEAVIQLGLRRETLFAGTRKRLNGADV